MKYLGSSFTIALGGDAFSEGYRIDWSKRPDPDGVPPQSHDTPDFSPEPKCKHCDQQRSGHFRGRDLGHFFEAED